MSVKAYIFEIYIYIFPDLEGYVFLQNVEHVIVNLIKFNLDFVVTVQTLRTFVKPSHIEFMFTVGFQYSLDVHKP